MCVALLEQQAVMVRDGDALVEGGEGALVLPDTVQGVIRARLDNLDSPPLEIARVAAVIGWEFDHALLVEVAPPSVDLRPAIDALEAAGLIQRTSVAPTIGYRFTHARTGGLLHSRRTSSAKRFTGPSAARSRPRTRIEWTSERRCSPTTSRG
jgi:predicted ATPase